MSSTSAYLLVIVLSTANVVHGQSPGSCSATTYFSKFVAAGQGKYLQKHRVLILQLFFLADIFVGTSETYLITFAPTTANIVWASTITAAITGGTYTGPVVFIANYAKGIIIIIISVIFPFSFI